MRLITYLNELNFVKSKDRDWPTKTNTVILFDKNDQYKIKGKTHGLTSHAIKHLNEFDPSFFDKVIKQAYDYISKQEFYILSKKTKKVSKRESISRNQVINTLDRINDKIINNQQLTNEEKNISKFIEDIKIRYEQHIDKFTNNTTNIDNYSYQELINNKPKHINFMIKEEGKNDRLYVDLSKLVFCVEDSKGFKTMYTYKTTNNLLDKILSKDVINQDIVEYLKL